KLVLKICQRDKKANKNYILSMKVAAIFVSSGWEKFSGTPIVVSVETTFYPLYKIPFPAITICPGNFIQKSTAERLLLQYLNVTRNHTMERDITYILRGLAKCQFPFFFRMQEYLEPVRHLLPLFNDLNVTDFMLQVLPKCKEMFGQCFWLGVRVNCCQVFQLQRTEAGFCYSYNSITSEVNKKCSVGDGFSNVISFPREDSEKSDLTKCEILHNSASGTATGIEVFLKRSNEDESIGLVKPGIQVMLHRSSQFPEIGKKTFVPEEENCSFHIEITPSMTESSLGVRALSIAQRKCLFPDEANLKYFRTYTEENCLMECRLDYMEKMCGCHPYFFSNITLAELRINRPPLGTYGFETMRAIDCSKCLPTCQIISRAFDYVYTYDYNPYSWNHSIYLDVYYKAPGAVKYNQHVAFDLMDLVVCFGGVVSLFLGISMLNSMQFLYKCLTMSCGIHQWRPKMKSRNIIKQDKMKNTMITPIN
ncbi:hypothetical protein L9F63_004376, partial [Diploptera punctata]